MEKVIRGDSFAGGEQAPPSCDRHELEEAWIRAKQCSEIRDMGCSTPCRLPKKRVSGGGYLDDDDQWILSVGETGVSAPRLAVAARHDFDLTCLRKSDGSWRRVSHLCHNSACMQAAHLAVESPSYGLTRTQCVGPLTKYTCEHCATTQMARTCVHVPACLAPGPTRLRDAAAASPAGGKMDELASSATKPNRTAEDRPNLAGGAGADPAITREPVGPVRRFRPRPCPRILVGSDDLSDEPVTPVASGHFVKLQARSAMKNRSRIPR